MAAAKRRHLEALGEEQRRLHLRRGVTTGSLEFSVNMRGKTHEQLVVVST
jgi:hypothetical protein